VTDLVLGVIGHVDHGKTALVRALTGTDTDRRPEEKQRGISIVLGFAHLRIGSQTQIDLIDMPGHERFVHTMVSGATGVDAVLLVVAANEGVKPQTLEHAHIAALLGLRRTVVAVNKVDLVEVEQAKRVADGACKGDSGPWNACGRRPAYCRLRRWSPARSTAKDEKEQRCSTCRSFPHSLRHASSNC
jgi:selenocysteine-specific elongation factor